MRRQNQQTSRFFYNTPNGKSSQWQIKSRRNIDGLAPRARLFAVDWLGTGRSGRPPFTAKSTAEAEAFFVDSLAAWRRAEGLDGQKMVLVGHSIGGYLAAAYALKHPDHVRHLVLVCPAGIVSGCLGGGGEVGSVEGEGEEETRGGTGQELRLHARACKHAPTYLSSPPPPPPPPTLHTTACNHIYHNTNNTKQPEKPDGWESRFAGGPAFRRLLFRVATGACESLLLSRVCWAALAVLYACAFGRGAWLMNA